MTLISPDHIGPAISGAGGFHGRGGVAVGC